MDSGVYSDFILCIESLTEISKALGGSGERNNVPDKNAKNKREDSKISCRPVSLQLISLLLFPDKSSKLLCIKCTTHNGKTKSDEIPCSILKFNMQSFLLCQPVFLNWSVSVSNLADPP